MRYTFNASCNDGLRWVEHNFCPPHFCKFFGITAANFIDAHLKVARDEKYKDWSIWYGDSVPCETCRGIE